MWGEKELSKRTWRNQDAIESLYGAQRFCGVADLMRWEILYNEGGFAIDADSECVRPLEEWLFPTKVVAWRNCEYESHQLIANGYVYSAARHPVIDAVLQRMSAITDPLADDPWKLTGPVPFTETIRCLRSPDVTMWPSFLMMPTHWDGFTFNSSLVFARQHWGSTHRSYGTF